MALIPYYGGIVDLSILYENKITVTIFCYCYNILKLNHMFGSAGPPDSTRDRFRDTTAEHERHIEKQKIYIQNVISSLKKLQRNRTKTFILSARALQEIKQLALPFIIIRSEKPCTFTRKKRLLVEFAR